MIEVRITNAPEGQEYRIGSVATLLLPRTSEEVMCLEFEPVKAVFAKGFEYERINYYQVRDNWQGRGYRLYFGDDHIVVQVHGEINGKVFDTINLAKTYCKLKFGEAAIRIRD